MSRSSSSSARRTRTPASSPSTPRAAARAPGVLAVLTARDMPDLRLHEIHIISELLAPPALATDVARFVGDPVALVVATTRAAALDAAELVDVTYEPLPVVVTADAAVRDDAPLLFPAHGSNVALAWDLDETDDAFAESRAATLTVRGEIDLPRLSTAPMEGHAIVVVPTGADGLHVYVSTQWPHGTRVQMARSFGLTLDQVRAQVPAVGGGFGGKSLGGIREHIATAAAARRLNRPVRYVEQRSDNLQSMQGRGVHIDYEADATSDGRVVHLRVDRPLRLRCLSVDRRRRTGQDHDDVDGPVPHRPRHVPRSQRDDQLAADRRVSRARPRRGVDGARTSDGQRCARARPRSADGARLAISWRPTELPKQSITGAHYDEADFARTDRAGPRHE